jgi:hypothetical protein
MELTLSHPLTRLIAKPMMRIIARRMNCNLDTTIILAD